jgi:hypothetical protein
MRRCAAAVMSTGGRDVTGTLALTRMNETPVRGDSGRSSVGRADRRIDDRARNGSQDGGRVVRPVRTAERFGAERVRRRR